jgi:uncharacterized protein (DUF433 family)
MIAFENKPELGTGIFTTGEVAKILKISYPKAYRWISKYWDGELGKEFGNTYSWKLDDSIAVNFYTLVEFYVFVELARKGVKTKEVLKAHKKLSLIYSTPYPFAKREVLDELNTDGEKVFWKSGDSLISLDGTDQFNLGFVASFFKKLEFDSENMVSKLWPLGKEVSIVVDPRRKFGHPIVDGRNIYPETLYGHFKAGDPVPYIAHIYEISEKEVNDAIFYCEEAA